MYHKHTSPTLSANTAAIKEIKAANVDNIDTLIKVLTTALINENTQQIKVLLSEHSDLIPNFDLSNDTIESWDDPTLYKHVATDVCSAENIKQKPDLDYCFQLALENLEILGVEDAVYSLMAEHYG